MTHYMQYIGNSNNNRLILCIWLYFSGVIGD